MATKPKLILKEKPKPKLILTEKKAPVTKPKTKGSRYA